MSVAAEFWRVELRGRTPGGWKRTGWASRKLVDDFVSRSSGAADLIFIGIDDTRVVHLVSAGDEVEWERMLAVARRDLLELSQPEFAREWGFPASA